MQALPVRHPVEVEREREAEVGNERERMGRIDRQRGQDREHELLEIAHQPFDLGRREVGRLGDHDAGALQLDAQLQPAPLLLGREFGHGRGDLGQLLGRRQPVLREGGDPGIALAVEAGHPHHKELIEVVGRDREKPEPLQQWVVRVGGFLQDAPVEFEPGDLAVDEPLGRGGEIGVEAGRFAVRFGGGRPGRGRALLFRIAVEHR